MPFTDGGQDVTLPPGASGNGRHEPDFLEYVAKRSGVVPEVGEALSSGVAAGCFSIVVIEGNAVVSEAYRRCL